MPQMAPMNWLWLFILFTMIFIIFNSMNYFSFMKTKNNKMKFSPKNYSLNWKW